MVILGFVFIGALVFAAFLTPLLALYWLAAKLNHPLDEKPSTNCVAPELHPEYHQQLRGIERS